MKNKADRAGDDAAEYRKTDEERRAEELEKFKAFLLGEGEDDGKQYGLPRASAGGQGDAPHAGHRTRMRTSARRDSELCSFTDAKLLELLLSFGVPYRDTDPLARALLKHYGSLLGVIRAPRRELYFVPGMTAAAVELIIMLSEFCRWDGKRDIRVTGRTGAAEFLRSVHRGTKQSGAVCAFYLDGNFTGLAIEQTPISPALPRAIAGSVCRYRAERALISLRDDDFSRPDEMGRILRMACNAAEAAGAEVFGCIIFGELGYYALCPESTPDDPSYLFVSYKACDYMF